MNDITPMQQQEPKKTSPKNEIYITEWSKGKEWRWNETKWGFTGVHIHNGNISWYQQYEKPKIEPSGKTQMFEDFLNNGPNIPDVPEKIVTILRNELKTNN